MDIQKKDRYIPHDELVAAFTEAVQFETAEDRLNSLKTLGSRVFSHWANLAKSDLLVDQIAEAIDGNRWSKVMDLTSGKLAINLKLLSEIAVAIGDAYCDIANEQKELATAA